MINNKGFTLIEVLAVILIISIISVFVINYIGNTLSINKNEAYRIMKDNIISSSYDYLEECNSKMLVCDLNWVDNKVTFYVEELKNVGYFSELNSPIDNKNLGNCLMIEAVRNNGSFDIRLLDDCY